MPLVVGLPFLFSMSKWEYNGFKWNDVFESNIPLLKSFGNDGWELVQVVGGTAILKRKVASEKKTTCEVEQDKTNFESCWHHYRRKGSKKKSYEQWQKLTEQEREQVANHIQAYVQSVSDIKYQKDFERYLRDKCFLNVVYKDGKTIFDAENKEEMQSDSKLIIGGVEYR